MPAPKKVPHFVINQMGTSADRRGPFESEEAATYWAEHYYHYPAWIVPAVPANDPGRKHRMLDKHGELLPQE